MALTAIDDRGAQGDFLAARRDKDRAFRAAQRHSRFVRALRVMLPLVVLFGGAGAIAAFTWIDPLRKLARLPVTAEGLVLSGTKITMQQPHLAGFTKDARPYSITARTAAQDVLKPNVLELKDIRAKMTSLDRGNIEVTARNGVYDKSTEMLLLKNKVTLRSPVYEVRLKQALVGIRTGHVVSDEPVVVKMLQGTINAERMEVLDSGAVIRFHGGVTMELQAIRRDDETGAVTP